MRKSGANQWNERQTAAANARRVLPAAAAAYFAQIREALAQDPAPDELHPLRLRTKRLRYTIELFRPCYGAGLERALTALRGLQSVLGEVNDCAVAARIAQQSVAPSRRRDQVTRFIEERAAGRAREFRRIWSEEFDAPGREAWWTSYLARATRR
jgi:CHAD domain-containing protein